MESERSHSPSKKKPTAMFSREIANFLAVIFVLNCLQSSIGFRCDRKPYGSNTQASPSDGRYKIEILGTSDNSYIPDQLYTGKLHSSCHFSPSIKYYLAL